MQIKMTVALLDALKGLLKSSMTEYSYSLIKDISVEDEPEEVEKLIGRALINELITDALKD